MMSATPPSAQLTSLLLISSTVSGTTAVSATWPGPSLASSVTSCARAGPLVSSASPALQLSLTVSTHTRTQEVTEVITRLLSELMVTPPEYFFV